MGRGILSQIFGLLVIAFFVWIGLAPNIDREDGRYDRACSPIDWVGGSVTSLAKMAYEAGVPAAQKYTYQTSRGCEFVLYRMFEEEKWAVCERDINTWKLYLNDLEQEPSNKDYVNSWVDYFEGKRPWVACSESADKLWRPTLARLGYYERYDGITPVVEKVELWPAKDADVLGSGEESTDES